MPIRDYPMPIKYIFFPINKLEPNNPSEVARLLETEAVARARANIALANRIDAISQAPATVTYVNKVYIQENDPGAVGAGSIWIIP